MEFERGTQPSYIIYTHLMQIILLTPCSVSLDIHFGNAFTLIVNVTRLLFNSILPVVLCSNIQWGNYS